MGTNAMLVLGFATEQTHISSRTDPEAEEIRWLKTFATIELGNPPEEYWEEVQRAADKDRLFRYFYYAPGADGEREVDVLDDAYGQPFRPLDYWQVVKILKAERQIVDYRRYKPAVELLEHAHGLTWETCPLILIHHGH